MFSRFSFSAFATLTAVGALAAATTATTDPAVKLDHFVVSASPFQRNQTDLAQATSILTGTALSLRQQPSLGETLAGLPGISSTFFGPGASRPIIRGLGGDRIRILENGTGTIDASSVSPDHAVGVEPFLIDRIEVVRGPASLLYGSSAVGGVVNLLTHRIETEVPVRPISGLLEARAETATDEHAWGGIVNVAASLSGERAVVLHLDGFRRQTSDVKIPGYAKSAGIRAVETAAALAGGGPAPEFARGALPNSGVDSRGGAAGLSFVTTAGHLGFAYSGFDTFYGVPKEEDVKIDLRQRRLDLQGETTQAFGLFSGARVKVGAADYSHRELEDGTVGTTFSNRGYDARAELLHTDLGGLAGVWGVQAGRSRLEALGDEAFLPPSQTSSLALFAFEEFRVGAFTPQFGGRFETQEIDLRDGTDRARDDRMFSFSVGTVWNPAAGFVVGLSLTRTERAPNAQELYADGPHLGTGAFEIGDATLSRERSLGAELNVRRRIGFVTGEVSVFANKFSGYLHEAATGEVAVDRGGHVLIAPAAVLAGEETLDVYQFVSTDADFHGAEAEAILHLHDTAQHKLDLRIATDFTRAEDGRGRPLPRIPAMRHTVGVIWQQGPWSAGADWQFTRAQNRLAANEEPSAGYGLLGAHAAWRQERGDGAWEIFVRGSNLTNEEARPHTSFLKNSAPLPGRRVGAGVRWIF
ncbi:MAG: TonB-dependent receptor [Candidatus Didemnitutus sp.]|nr:TonB-dependent receptor [Candidatus Didemnitutus sp.]